MTPAVDYILVFDGGSLGNPGRGYGSYSLYGPDQRWSDPVRLEFGARVTNNEAEYRALLAGLAAVSAECGDPRATTVEVRGDSRLVIEHLRGAWKVRAPNLVPLHAAARRAVADFKHVRLTWQPRERSVARLGH